MYFHVFPIENGDILHGQLRKNQWGNRPYTRVGPHEGVHGGVYWAIWLGMKSGTGDEFWLCKQKKPGCSGDSVGMTSYPVVWGLQETIR